MKKRRVYPPPAEIMADIQKPLPIECTGDAMSPVIPDPSVIYIDEADRELVEGGIYVFHFSIRGLPGGGRNEMDPALIQPRRVLQIRADGFFVGIENPELVPWPTWFIFESNLASLPPSEREDLLFEMTSLRTLIVENDALKVWGKLKAVGRPTRDEEVCEWSRVPSGRSLQ